MRGIMAASMVVLLATSGAAFERTEHREACAQHDPLRRPFFGDTHVHTAYSFDASTQDTRNTPRDAYRFARGEPMGIQPYDERGEATRTIQLDRPLDWTALSDHSELLGTVRVCMTEGMDGYWHPACIAHRNLPSLARLLIASRTLVAKTRWGLCGDDGARCAEQRGIVWGEIRDAAEEAYDRTAACSFTSFVGYEWTGTVGEGQNLHRNVIFRNEKVPDMPVSWVDTPSALDLWDRLQAECVEGKPGCDALTIPHNSNISGGLIFQSAGITSPEDEGMEIGVDEARRRSRWEPLVELVQHKGESECDIAAGWTDDEACGFEKLPYDRFGAKMSMFVSEQVPAASNFARDALKQGLLVARRHGANPFQFGFIGSTDSHIAAPGQVAEEGHPGHGGAGIGAHEAASYGFPDDFEFGPGGLAVLWAAENSRDALFSAMQRREAYATSGTRPQVRFFGGWDYPADLCEREDFVARGYADGVPMGADLPERPDGAGAPTLAVWAMRDAASAARPLERIQIVKGWVEGDEAHEKVVLVAGGEGGADVDLATCQPTGSAGSDTLCSVWTDPDFDPAQGAFYYARVLEDPTCRWSQYVCNAAGVDCADPASIPDALAPCCSDQHRPKLQERAWTSPIWYTPR